METESPDVKKLEKLFKKQLNEIEADKEMLQVELKNKNRELSEVHLLYRDKEVLNFKKTLLLMFRIKIIKFLS